MAYTLWHCGVLAGESDFEEQRERSEQRAGIFRPTAYGLHLFPRISGMLSASAELKDEIQRRGWNDETIAPEQTMELLETTTAGQRVIDIGRQLSQMELRNPTGETLEFASIAFTDLGELAALSTKLGCDHPDEFRALQRSGQPQFIVSATLRCHWV